MPEKEKKTGKKTSTKKRPGKAAEGTAASESVEQPSPQELDRDRLESLREKLQRKFH
jgi:hypothetical protein